VATMIMMLHHYHCVAKACLSLTERKYAHFALLAGGYKVCSSMYDSEDKEREETEEGGA